MNSYLLFADKSGIQIGGFFPANLVAHPIDVDIVGVWEIDLDFMDVLFHFMCFIVLHFVDYSDSRWPKL